MNLAGKSVRFWGVRGSQLGDCICALVVYRFVEKVHPSAFKYWQLARRHSAAIPLFANAPDVTQLVISDCDEGMGPRDRAIAATCDIVFDVMPPHRLQPDWPNHRGIVLETFTMAGLDEVHWATLTEEERRPRLAQWFELTPQSVKTVCLWPAAAYGVRQIRRSRNPDHWWYVKLVERLEAEGYKPIQCGHPDDFPGEPPLVPQADCRHLPLFDQFKLSLSASVSIGTDSGAALVLGCYGGPQVSILTDHFPNHTRNPTAFATPNANNRNVLSQGDANNASVDEVIAAIREVTSS